MGLRSSKRLYFQKVNAYCKRCILSILLFSVYAILNYFLSINYYIFIPPILYYFLPFYLLCFRVCLYLQVFPSLCFEVLANEHFQTVSKYPCPDIRHISFSQLAAFHISQNSAPSSDLRSCTKNKRKPLPDVKSSLRFPGLETNPGLMNNIMLACRLTIFHSETATRAQNLLELEPFSVMRCLRDA